MSDRYGERQKEMSELRSFIYLNELWSCDLDAITPNILVYEFANIFMCFPKIQLYHAWDHNLIFSLSNYYKNIFMSIYYIYTIYYTYILYAYIISNGCITYGYIIVH